MFDSSEPMDTGSFVIFLPGITYEWVTGNADPIVGKFQGVNKIGETYIIVVQKSDGALHNIVSSHVTSWSIKDSETS